MVPTPHWYCKVNGNWPRYTLTILQEDRTVQGSNFEAYAFYKTARKGKTNAEQYLR